MASSLTSPIPPLAVQIEWYKIRDLFFGANSSQQDISLALQLAAACKHPDAVWLTEVCGGKDIKSLQDAGNVFLGCGENDARALCFACKCKLGDRVDA
jgi:hypothetical protein